MAARVAIFALCVTAVRCSEPAARIYIEAPKAYKSKADLAVLDGGSSDIENRYTKELVEDLKSTKNDVLLLYTEYTAQAAEDLERFLSNISMLARDTISNMDRQILDRASKKCNDEFDKSIYKIIYDSHKAAGFSGENHHKYFRGHMVVFNIHLNRGEDYIKRCEKIYNGCGIHCETTSRMMRWRRLALRELNRVKDDIQHSRRSYSDLLLHSRRKLKKLRTEAQVRADAAVHAAERCV